MELLVAADDRTGALEAAGLLAERLAAPIPVAVWPDDPGGDVAVVDLGSRHLSRHDARNRAVAVGGATRHAHKLDSALRGNWADELAGRLVKAPVLVVPALPHAGRICSGGVVLDHGRPVHEGAAGSDARSRVKSSRPAELLRAAGAETIVELSTAGEVAEWCTHPAGAAVADAATDTEIAAIVTAWQQSDPSVVLAGPSAVVGHAAGASEVATVPRFRQRAGATLVVCGSLHPIARAQIAFAEHRGIPVTSLADTIAAAQLRERGVMILASEIPAGDLDEPLAIAAAAGLARGVSDLRAQVDVATVILIGGDTAAAVLGDGVAFVHGTIDVGTAWVTLGDDPLPYVTRSGGFGSEASLEHLIETVLRS